MFELWRRPCSRACKLDGEDLLIMTEADVLVVIEPTTGATKKAANQKRSTIRAKGTPPWLQRKYVSAAVPAPA